MAAVAVQSPHSAAIPDRVPDLNPTADSQRVRIVDLAAPEASTAIEVSKACLENGFFYGENYLQMGWVDSPAGRRLLATLCSPQPWSQPKSARRSI